MMQLNRKIRKKRKQKEGRKREYLGWERFTCNEIDINQCWHGLRKFSSCVNCWDWDEFVRIARGVGHLARRVNEPDRGYAKKIRKKQKKSNCSTAYARLSSASTAEINSEYEERSMGLSGKGTKRIKAKEGEKGGEEGGKPRVSNTR